MLRRSVRRDMEALLNARRRWRSWPSRATANSPTSPVGYGIPRLRRRRVQRSRRSATACGSRSSRPIRRFEPRFLSCKCRSC